MGTKNISISEEAYSRLAAEKRETESFTDVINRLTGKRSILELRGLLTSSEGEQMRSEIQKARIRSERRLETTGKKPSILAFSGTLKEDKELKFIENEARKLRSAKLREL